MIDCCWHTDCHQSQHSDKWHRGVAAGEIMQLAHRQLLIISPVCAHSAALQLLSVTARHVIMQRFLLITNHVLMYTWLICFGNICSCSLSVCVVAWENPSHGQIMSICYYIMYIGLKTTGVSELKMVSHLHTSQSQVIYSIIKTSYLQK